MCLATMRPIAANSPGTLPTTGPSARSARRFRTSPTTGGTREVSTTPRQRAARSRARWTCPSRPRRVGSYSPRAESDRTSRSASTSLRVAWCSTRVSRLFPPTFTSAWKKPVPCSSSTFTRRARSRSSPRCSCRERHIHSTPTRATRSTPLPTATETRYTIPSARRSSMAEPCTT